MITRVKVRPIEERIRLLKEFHHTELNENAFEEADFLTIDTIPIKRPYNAGDCEGPFWRSLDELRDVVTGEIIAGRPAVVCPHIVEID